MPCKHRQCSLYCTVNIDEFGRIWAYVAACHVGQHTQARWHGKPLTVLLMASRKFEVGLVKAWHKRAFFDGSEWIFPVVLCRCQQIAAAGKSTGSREASSSGHLNKRSMRTGMVSACIVSLTCRLQCLSFSRAPHCFLIEARPCPGEEQGCFRIARDV